MTDDGLSVVAGASSQLLGICLAVVALAPAALSAASRGSFIGQALRLRRIRLYYLIVVLAAALFTSSLVMGLLHYMTWADVSWFGEASGLASLGGIGLLFISLVGFSIEVAAIFQGN